MRVSLPGVNALTATDPDSYPLYSDEDWVLIKEQARGVGTVGYGDTAEITHSLGYIPFYMAFCETDTDTYQLSFSYNIYGGWRTYSDTTKLYINNSSGTAVSNYRYYIFYDLLK